jgi:hypothetical protein
MALLASKQHTAGDKRLWTVNYSRWLDNTATIEQADVTSGSDTCDIVDITILGKDVVFFLDGGDLGETFVVTITITDSFGNTKTDTISFHVLAP